MVLFLQKRDMGLTQKYYEDGSLFVVMFADGTGTVYYHSGRHAISITVSGMCVCMGDWLVVCLGVCMCLVV